MAMPDAMTSGNKSRHSMAALHLLVLVIPAAGWPNGAPIGPFGFIARASFWLNRVLVASLVLVLGLSRCVDDDATDFFMLTST